MKEKLDKYIADNMEKETKTDKEIKEILDEEKYIEMLEDGELYNYITNLEQENALLENVKDNHIDIIDGMEKTLYDYKLKIDKAIPKLKELNIKLKDILKIGIDIKEISDIENILTGGDEE